MFFALVVLYLPIRLISGKKMKKKKTSKTIKDLHLDKPTSHGGWPGGKPGGYTDPDTPVYKQIAKYLKDMGLIDDNNSRARLSESTLRTIIRTILSRTDN